MFPITKRIILQSFNDWTYTKGEGYFSHEMVLSWKLNNSVVTGKVEGNFKPSYIDNLSLKNEILHGTCTCPVGTQCKHCVALALQCLEDQTIKESPKKKKKRMYDEDYNEDYDEEEIEENDLNNEEKFENKKLEFTLEIPKKLITPQIKDISEYIQSFPRYDLENLFLYLMSIISQDSKITIFSSEFILKAWNPILMKLDEKYEADKKEELNTLIHSNSIGTDVGVSRLFPLQIFKQIKDTQIKQQCLQSWFQGYANLINELRKECWHRGMFEAEGEDLYEYYKNEEYDRLETEFEKNDDDQYEKGHRRWDYDYDDELEPYEDFDLDSSTLITYLNDFFHWYFAPIQEICDYITLLYKYNLDSYGDFLSNKGMHWILDLELPLNKLGIDLNKITALRDLKTIVISKLTITTKQFMNVDDHLEFLFKLFTQNPSAKTADIVWDQLQNCHFPEENIKYFIKKILNEYKTKPKWDKFQLLKKSIMKYGSITITQFVNIIIDTLPKGSDAELILNEIYSILGQRSASEVVALKDELLKSALRFPKKGYEKKGIIYIQTVDWLVEYFKEQCMYDQCFNLLANLMEKFPKSVTFNHYKTIQYFYSVLNSKKITEMEKLNLLILQKGSLDLKFRVHIELEQYDCACLLLNTYKTTSISYLHQNPQWNAIMLLIPQLKNISEKNKDLLIKILKSHISIQFTKKNRNRPDASIAEIVKQIKMIYHSMEKKNGADLWQKWLKDFSNKYWRLRNLRLALSRIGIMMNRDK